MEKCKKSTLLTIMCLCVALSSCATTVTATQTTDVEPTAQSAPVDEQEEVEEEDDSGSKQEGRVEETENQDQMKEGDYDLPSSTPKIDPDDPQEGRVEKVEEEDAKKRDEQEEEPEIEPSVVSSDGEIVVRIGEAEFCINHDPYDYLNGPYFSIRSAALDIFESEEEPEGLFVSCGGFLDLESNLAYASSIFYVKCGERGTKVTIDRIARPKEGWWVYEEDHYVPTNYEVVALLIYVLEQCYIDPRDNIAGELEGLPPGYTCNYH